jgi:hypothetical protein
LKARGNTVLFDNRLESHQDRAFEFATDEGDLLVGSDILIANQKENGPNDARGFAGAARVTELVGDLHDGEARPFIDVGVVVQNTGDGGGRHMRAFGDLTHGSAHEASEELL